MKDEKHTEEDLEYARDEFAEMMKVGAPEFRPRHKLR